MYTDTIFRPSAAPRPKQPFGIRLPIPYNESAAYVDTVCACLIESRFGPGRTSPIVVHLSQWPEQQKAVFYDLTTAGLVPCYTIVPDSEMARRYAAAMILDEFARLEMAYHSNRSQTITPSNQGRGSP